MRCTSCTADPLWRGGLSDRRTAPFGCEAVVNPDDAVYLNNRGVRFWGRSATQREQAPSPQLSVFQT